MATMEVKTLNATNAEILNAIRTDASYVYQQRIPEVTQGDITAAVQALQHYTPEMNEFVDALVNRIGLTEIRSKIWTNPLAQFKRGLMEYGSTIEEVYVDILNAKNYDPDADHSDVFKQTKPDVQANFHTINRQNQYPVTLNDMLLKRAFVDSYGLQNLVGSILERPYTSDHWDEYLIMRQLFQEYARNGWFYKVQVPDAASATTFDDKRQKAAAITEAVRSYAMKLAFMSRDYNASNVATFSKREELVLFCTPEFVAMLDVNVLAFAFNVSAAEINTRVVVVDELGIDGAQAILADKDFFVCADTFINFESIRNPKGRYWNYFLNHDGIYSCSRFVNAILFTTEAGTSVTVPTIALTGCTVDYKTPEGGTKPTFAEKGAITDLVATVAGTVTPETPGYSVPQSVVWTISGTSGKKLSMSTFIDAEGSLHVDENEPNEWVEVTATTTYLDPSKPLSGQTAQTGKLKVGIGKAAGE